MRDASFASLGGSKSTVSFLFLMTREKFQCVSTARLFISNNKWTADAVGRPGRHDAQLSRRRWTRMLGELSKCVGRFWQPEWFCIHLLKNTAFQVRGHMMPRLTRPDSLRTCVKVAEEIYHGNDVFFSSLTTYLVFLVVLWQMGELKRK